MLKKFFLFVFVLLLLIPFWSKINAQTPQEVIVFIREGCIHCKNEEKFLDGLAKQRDDIKISKYYLENPQQRKIWEEFTQRLELSKVTPITIIGQDYLVGFDKPETTGKEIVQLIGKAREGEIKTDLNKVEKTKARSPTSTCLESGLDCVLEENDGYNVNVPFLGKVNTQSYPLFALSALLGFVDGFNPCAMWVLITFLIILLQVGNRKKMFIFAGTFILAEAIMYSLILTVWYKTWDFVKLDEIVTPLVGIVSIIGGLFFLREWRKKDLECRVANPKQRQKILSRVQELAIAKFSLSTFVAILAIAFSVNILEFACSIGIPQAFTKILELNQLPLLQTIGYIATYIFFYMVDDLLVFALALYGAEKLALTTKYSRYSSLIGGILMMLIGLLLIFKPSLLLF